LKDVELQIMNYIERINKEIQYKKVIENENLVLRKDKYTLNRQLSSLEPLKKLQQSIEQSQFELNQNTLI